MYVTGMAYVCYIAGFLSHSLRLESDFKSTTAKQNSHSPFDQPTFPLLYVKMTEMPNTKQTRFPYFCFKHIYFSCEND